jgi:hypothetical protein
VQIDFAALTGGQIALVTATAALVAAIVAGTFGIVVSLINAWSANRLARLNARRQFRLDSLNSWLNTLDSEVRMVRDVLTPLTYDGPHSTAQINKYVDTLRHRERTVRNQVAWSIVPSQSQTSKAIAYVNAYSNELDDVLNDLIPHLSRNVTETDFFKQGGVDRMVFVKALSAFVIHGMDARRAVEDFIFK